jgi:hypothetical protein
VDDKTMLDVVDAARPEGVLVLRTSRFGALYTNEAKRPGQEPLGRAFPFQLLALRNPSTVSATTNLLDSCLSSRSSLCPSFFRRQTSDRATLALIAVPVAPDRPGVQAVPCRARFSCLQLGHYAIPSLRPTSQSHSLSTPSQLAGRLYTHSPRRYNRLKLAIWPV